MGDIVNLRQARKARDRKLAEQAAAEARALHGRTKGQRVAEKAEAERLAKAVAASKLDKN
jgi:tRNA-dihydrouridine synthase